MKLTEKNLEAAFLNLTTTDKPITIKPTTWFGNPAKTAQWYKCPNCAKQSPLTLEWVGLTDDDIFLVLGNLQTIYNRPLTEDSRIIFARAIEAKLRSKNNAT
jgi:hypothetical protein